MGISGATMYHLPIVLNTFRYIEVKKKMRFDQVEIFCFNPSWFWMKDSEPDEWREGEGVLQVEFIECRLRFDDRQMGKVHLYTAVVI